MLSQYPTAYVPASCCVLINSSSVAIRMGANPPDAVNFSLCQDQVVAFLATAHNQSQLYTQVIT